MEDVPDNPATRLLDFLTKLKSYGADAQVRISICRALDLDTDMPLPEVLHYLTVVMSWPDEIESLVNGLTEVNKVRLLRWRPHIDETMVGLAHLTAPLQSTLAQYNVTDLTDLEHCADTLHFRAPEPVMTTEKLDDLGALIRQAIDAVIADTDLTDEARHWLVTQLRDVEQAVIHFRIAGYRGVEEAMERLCGGMARRPEAQNPETAGWFMKIWNKFMLGLTGVEKLGTASQSVFGMLEAGSDFLNGS